MQHNPDAESCIFRTIVFVFKLSSGLYVRVVKLLCGLCSVAILVYNNNNEIILNFVHFC